VKTVLESDGFIVASGTCSAFPVFTGSLRAGFTQR
jgi:hypothetical protein